MIGFAKLNSPPICKDYDLFMRDTTMTTLSHPTLPWPHLLPEHTRQGPRVLLGMAALLMRGLNTSLD